MKAIIFFLATIIFLICLMFAMSQISEGAEIPYWLEIAQAEVGKGETVANNKGPDIKRYGQGKDGQPWCTTFVRYCLMKGGIFNFQYSIVAREIWNESIRLGWKVDTPWPGDIIVFWRDKPYSWKGHIGIIEQIYANKIIVIEGNKGPFPAKVVRFEYDLDNIPKLLGFVRPEK